MSAFKVGDRVRIVRADPEFLGREATIIGRALLEDWLLDIDGFGAHDARGRPWTAMSSYLEPILPLPTCADILALTRLPEGPVRVGEVA